MLYRAYKLRQVHPLVSLCLVNFTDQCCQAINLFVSSADEVYGPITTIHREGRTIKHIPWAAFKLSEGDWQRVLLARNILEVRTTIDLKAGIMY